MEGLHWRYLPKPCQRIFIRSISYQRKTHNTICRQRSIRKLCIPVLRVYKKQEQIATTITSYVKGEVTTSLLVLSMGDDPMTYLLFNNMTPIFQLRYLFQQILRDLYIQQLLQQIHIPGFVSIHLLHHLIYLLQRIP